MNGRRWTEQEDSLLREMYQVQSLRIEDIASRVGRDVRSVYDRAHKLRIKKPNRSWMWRAVGSERANRDGYLVRKVAEGRWRFVHIIRWEEVHGPLPRGMALKSLDGDRLNTDPSNWISVPRGLLPRLNGRYGRDYDTAPRELKPSILAVAQLEHAVADTEERA